jgi:hypothetical protein
LIDDSFLSGGYEGWRGAAEEMHLQHRYFHYGMDSWEAMRSSVLIWIILISVAMPLRELSVVDS